MTAVAWPRESHEPSTESSYNGSYGPEQGGRLSEPDAPSIAGRVFSAMSAWETRQMPTATQRRDAELAGAALATLSRDLEALVSGPLGALRAALDAAGAPWTPRR